MKHNTPTCSIEDCDRDAHCKTYCRAHYAKYRKYGDPLAGGTYQRNKGKACTVDECATSATIKGHCRYHWDRLRLTGSTAPPERATYDPICAAQGCDQPQRTKGYCVPHYAAWRYHGDPLASKERHETCTVDGCDKPHLANGLCAMHRSRLRRQGELGGPDAQWEWKDYVSYQLAHKRMREQRGRAAEYPCTHCDTAAEHWAYDHGDPGHLICPDTGCAYSLDMSHYIPLCVPCHGKFDATHESEGTPWLATGA